MTSRTKKTIQEQPERKLGQEIAISNGWDHLALAAACAGPGSGGRVASQGRDGRSPVGFAQTSGTHPLPGSAPPTRHDRWPPWPIVS